MLTVFARRAALRRFSETPRRSLASTLRQKQPPSHLEHGSHFLDAVARATRNRMSTTEAVSYAVHMNPSTAPYLSPIATALIDGSPLTTAVRSLDSRAPRPYVTVGHALIAASSAGTFVPTALERSSAMLRDEARAIADADSHTAHIQLSLRVLTWLPISLLVMSLLFSRTTRFALASTNGLFVITLIGLSLNLVGRLWITRMKNIRLSESHDELINLMSFLITSIQAGYGIIESFDVHARHTSSRLSYEILKRISHGETIRDSLATLVRHFGDDAQPIVEAMSSSLIDGLPISATIDQLSRELASEHKRQREAHVRSMPVRMAFPLVAAVLPSFVLLAVVPLVGFTHAAIGQSPLT